MPGLVPGIHVINPGRRSRTGNRLSCNGSDDAFNIRARLGVDGRDKPGHDGGSAVSIANEA
jgi:hypothetical protein